MNTIQKGFFIAGLVVMNGIASAALTAATSGEQLVFSMLLCNFIAGMSAFGATSAVE